MLAQEHTIHCPYCGEAVVILVDPSAVPQEYVEDCQVCCRPIEITVKHGEGEELTVLVRAEDEPRLG